MSFNNLGLSAPLLKAISKKGYTQPSPVQEKAIPVVLEGKDILASAQTGTGKTAGFTLPILQILSQEPPQKKRKLRALILTPTRELAAQILDNVREYGEFVNIRSAVIFGGVGANPQIRQLQNGVDILVATPGRLLDLEGQKALSLKNVDILVLDEADRMLDMGFQRDINKILALLPQRRQNLLFSATFSSEIKKLASGILHNPVTVEATPENTTAEKVSHKAFRVDKKQKTRLITQIIEDENMKQVLVFTRTKHGANRLSEKLNGSGISAAAIHGNKSQTARTNALSGFKAGKVRILVATDIAARGLDIPLLPHVINFELPNIPEDYVHRIGRTGRAGASGEAISLVSLEEISYLRSIERLLSEKIPIDTVEGFPLLETQADIDAEPKINNFRPRKQNGQANGRSNNFRSTNNKSTNKKKFQRSERS